MLNQTMRYEKLLRKDMAKQRIEILFNLAEKIYPQSMSLANRYVEIARNISMRCNVRLDKRERRKFCHHCYSFLVPSVNCRVRLRGRYAVVTCLNCGNHMRYRYK
ncbi:ribonuclease P [Candidatus Methanoliparum sp. LAM-1]|nr:ribonuclease P [Candidatus Methanoliparum sp. LAM-1]